MTLESEKILDETGWRLLQELQQNARLSYTELGQRVGLSLPSVAERVHKMEEAGILTGYHAEVDLTKLGLPILAIIRLGSFVGQSCDRVASQVSEIPEVLECYKVTGTDCVVVKVVAASIDHLERIIEQVSLYGPAATSIVFSRPMKRHTITHELLSSSGGERAAVRKRRHQRKRVCKQDLNQLGGKIIHWVGSRAEPKRSNPRSTGKACWHLG